MHKFCSFLLIAVSGFILSACSNYSNPDFYEEGFGRVERQSYVRNLPVEANRGNTTAFPTENKIVSKVEVLPTEVAEAEKVAVNVVVPSEEIHIKKYLEDEVVAEKEKLGEFETSFENPAKGRRENITLASKLINGTIIKSGEVFSFNDVVGPTTEANGFKLARIFVNGEEAEGFGGGVCQVSSTLFNSVVEGDFEIVERHPHSKEVSYVDEGHDAATSYGVIDFKFKNNKDFAVIVKSEVEGETVSVSIEEYNEI